MTEPHVASSDATNIQLEIRKDDNEWVLNGRKWFITGAMFERTRTFIVMGKSDPKNPNLHLQQTQQKNDGEGVPASVDMIAATKTTVPLLVQNVIYRCMKIHGAGGLTENYFMA